MYKAESLEKLAGGVISDHLTYGPVGSLAARREQIINEIAEAEVEAQKNKASSKARPKAHAISELLGPITSHLATGLAGAGIGALAGGRQGMMRGAAIGGSLSYASKAIAAIAAAIKRRRTKEEQLENDKGSILKKYLIPGLAEYDLFKRQGRAFDENDERIDERVKALLKKQEKKASEKSAQDVIVYDPRFMKQIVENQIAREEAENRDSGANPRKHNLAEKLAPVLHALAAGGIGGAVGYGIGSKHGPAGAGLGTYAGTIGGLTVGALAHAAGLVAAHISKRRSKQEQVEADKKSVLAKYLIPGVAGYEGSKREERALDENKSREKTAQANAQTGSTWDSLNGWLDKAKSWWHNDLDQWQRDLFSLGGGALAGHAVNRLLGGEGVGGLVAGGLTGLAASSFDWKGLANALGKKQETQKAKG